MRYREPPKTGVTNDYGITYSPIDQQKSVLNTMYPVHQGVLNTVDNVILKNAYYHGPSTYATEGSSSQPPICFAQEFHNYGEDLLQIDADATLQNAYHHVPCTSDNEGCSKMQEYGLIYKPVDEYPTLLASQLYDYGGGLTSTSHNAYSSQMQQCEYISKGVDNWPTSLNQHVIRTQKKNHIDNNNNMRSEINVKNKTSTRQYTGQKRQRPCEKTLTNRRDHHSKRQQTSGIRSSHSPQSNNEGVSHLYIDIGDFDYACHYCNATFWYGERLKGNSHKYYPKYTKCCGGGQLYNVVGAHEYQLPTSGTLGAIVIQPDPNSQTDYDIIIEYKDKQPKRINKLNSSYMSLQFPLLFVYGQPGYNTKLTLKSVDSNKKRNKLSMNMYYKYQLHERFGIIENQSSNKFHYEITEFEKENSPTTCKKYTVNASNVFQLFDA
ncbi:helitron helicase-like domain-containing protein [Artemisia annua]|uniref:Helitron helicase-like domain-containing protein n=1 Tax=Artemisia annua TaxID=35608 RepID=A0A2U1LIV1_ARTAN|nr:helitron helicase-like domain-containing protein [Artemisia annua]